MTEPAHESILLLTLEEVSQLVAHSRDSSETLANIVALIQGRFRSDVCSVYVLEPERDELVLGATIGLSPQSVGQLRMRRDEGLTGLVAATKGPVMVADAFRHPRFKYFPEAGEDPYHSFLGVPLIEGGTVQGVLVIQNREVRTFTNDEVRLLVTVAAQLAPLVSNARLLRQLVTAAHAPRLATPLSCEPTALCLAGVTLSPGAGTGDAYLVNGFFVPSADAPAPADLDAERRRLAGAMEAARAELARLSRHISELVGEDHGAILQAQLMILQDREVEQDVTGWLAVGCAAETALVRTLDKYVAAFAEVADPFFRERVYDIKDVFRRVLWHLRPLAAGGGDGPVVLVAHEASVLDLFSVDRERLAGVVVEHGGPQCHAAILARSLGVPMIGQVANAVGRIKPGVRLRVDGTAGTVQIDPPDEAPPVSPLPAGEVRIPSPQPHLDGSQVRPLVLANVNLLSEVAPGLAQGAAGVGLYRTEFLFLARRTFPTEEEQLRIYRKLLELLGGRPATIRTFDLRPDKLAAGTGLSADAFRAFDWRRVLDSPPLQQLFKEQVRAILRAGAAGPARILIPLVSHTEQLAFVCATIAQARADLAADDLAFARQVPLGAMIEVAAAAALVPAWADQVDYFALGTNDLIATALGLDRNDPVGTSQDDLLHPGILRIIDGVIKAAHRAGKPVTVCGEMASDPDGALALAALGVDSLSVAVDRLGAVFRRLAEVPAAILTDQAEQLLALPTAASVRAFFQDLLRDFRSEGRPSATPPAQLSLKT